MIATIHQFGQLCVKHLLRTMVCQIYVMGKENINSVNAYPFKTELNRPHYPIVGIIINFVPCRDIKPLIKSIAFVLGSGLQQTSDFG